MRSLEDRTMRQSAFALAFAMAFVAACGDSKNTTSPTQGGSTLSFFVSSAKSTTGNLGGLRGADALCQTLATTVNAGNKTWRAYLSVERDANNGNQPTHARNRIGNGPWFNAKGTLVANNVTELHARGGDSTVFVDERGQPINGQWTGSPSPVEHDILTGSNADGTLMTGMTGAAWTSASATHAAEGGHAEC